MEALLQLDTDVLLWLNGFYTPFGDGFMWLYSQKLPWLPLYAMLIAYVAVRWRKQSGWILLAILVAVGLSDFVASGIIKPLVERPRPTREIDLENVLHIVNGYRSGKYGFVSSHAANSFALATLLITLSKDKLVSLMIIAWATVNAYSRIYLGVHYPLDILCGATLGIAIALLCYGLLKRFRPQALDACCENKRLSYGVFGTWLLSMVVMAVFAA